MRKVLTILPIVFINLVALSSEVPQKNKQEIIGQLNPFSNEIYMQLKEIKDDLKVLNESDEELKYELNNNILKVNFKDTNKPKKIIIQNGEEDISVTEIYPKSQINEKVYRDKNYMIFELDNSYLYNANKIEQGEYTTVLYTEDVSLEIKALSQPYTALSKNEKAVIGKININIYNYDGNQIESEELKVYEEIEKVDIPQKEIYHKKFKEPVKVQIIWKFDLGAYKTYIYDKESDISFIKDINLKLKCKNLDYVIYD